LGERPRGLFTAQYNMLWTYSSATQYNAAVHNAILQHKGYDYCTV